MATSLVPAQVRASDLQRVVVHPAAELMQLSTQLVIACDSPDSGQKARRSGCATAARSIQPPRAPGALSTEPTGSGSSPDRSTTDCSPRSVIVTMCGAPLRARPPEGANTRQRTCRGQRGLVGNGDPEARVGFMKVGVPKEVKNHEYRVAITADRRARAGGPRPRGRHPEGRRRRLVDQRRRVRRRRRHDRRHRRRGVGHRRWRRHGAQGQGARRRGVRPDAGGAGAVHLPAPGRGQAAHRGAAQPQGHRHRLRDGAAALGRAAAALPDVRGRGLPGARRSVRTRC